MKPAQIYAEAGVEVIIVKQSADGVIIAEAGGIKFPCRIEHLTESPASIKPVTKVEAVPDELPATRNKSKPVKSKPQSQIQMF